MKPKYEWSKYSVTKSQPSRKTKLKLIHTATWPSHQWYLAIVHLRRALRLLGSTALQLHRASLQQPWSKAEKAHDAKAVVAERRVEAKARLRGRGLPECMNFTLVRNGTCMKCDTCGSTTGRS
jgi:hypothetical protein